MEIIGDNTCFTSIRPNNKVVQCRGEQHKYWLELRFVDENNTPVSGLNVRLEYHPLASARDVEMWRQSGYDYNPTPPPNPPYIHNQVLELADPARDMDRKAMRDRFRKSVEQKASFSHPDEVERNREFLALQDMLPVALRLTQAENIGKNALLRFSAVTEEEVELSQ